jgi:methionine synthase II (cobalamin-independent)
MRVLLVEDDDVLRDVLCRSLTAAGHRVDVAGDVQNAHHLWGIQSYDAVLLDLNLPTNAQRTALPASGLEVLRAARARGDDPNELPHRYAAFINKVVAQKPAGMTLAMHLCRGNFKSTHAAAGNYEPVAEALLSEMNIDAYFLEYDDDRSGDFRPLRYLAKDKLVVLGLVTTKFGAMETKDSLKRRIDEAAKYAPLSQLALSPQCGFSSTVHGNNIAVEDQRNKLRLVVETAQEVWGDL